MMWRLPSGRVVQTVIRDENGQPRFYEILDTRRNAREIFYGPAFFQKTKHRSEGFAISEANFPEVMEFYLEDEQQFFRRLNEAGDQIILPGAFGWTKPDAGDCLEDDEGNTYTVEIVPPGEGRCPWNGVLMLDKAVPEGTHLRWKGEARNKNLIRFVADDGMPESPTPGEDTSGDVGTGYGSKFAPTITYLLERQEPATIGPKPFGRDKENKPRIRDEFRDLTRPQITQRVYGQRFENLFAFRCLHPRSAVATELAAWLKRFMRINAPYLRSSGLNELMFWSLEAERRTRRGGDDVSVRKAIYYVRTEELTLQEISALRNVDVHISGAIDQRVFQKITGPVPTDGLDPYTGIYDESGFYPWGTYELLDHGTTGIAP